MSGRTDERTITQDDVRKEHVASVNRPAHWAYLLVVLIGSTVLMIVLIAWLAASS